MMHGRWTSPGDAVARSALLRPQPGRALAYELAHVFRRLSSAASFSPSRIQRQGHRRHHAAGHPATPTLGGCRPAQDDLRPTAPWADLQRGYRHRCASAASDVAGQVGHALSDIVHGRMPHAPHAPDARGSVDCFCANLSPENAARAAMARVLAAGPLAARLFSHFREASGTPVNIDVADMIARSAGVRAKIFGHQ
jgi:hypothetical protein